VTNELVSRNVVNDSLIPEVGVVIVNEPTERGNDAIPVWFIKSA